MALPEMWRQQGMYGQAKHFRFLIAKHRLRTAVGFGDDALAIGGDNCHVRNRQNVSGGIHACPRSAEFGGNACRDSG